MRSRTVRMLVRSAAVMTTLGLVSALMALPASAVAGSIAVAPGSGTPGQTGIVITGTGTDFFAAGVTVTIGTKAATFSINSATQLTATVPCNANTGVGLVVVNDTAGPPVNTPFTVVVPALPTITGFVPATGPVGTVLKITGTNFTCASPPAGSVTVGGGTTPASGVNIVSSSEIRATVAGGTSTGVVKVTTPGGTAASVSPFTVNAAAPVINSFSPTTGPVGTVVNVVGLNFTNPPTATINGIQAPTVTFLSATNLHVTVPSGATSGKITVTATGGTATSLDDFTVTGPTITSFSPTSGPVGTSVLINGTNLTGTTTVKFNGTSTTFSVNGTGTQITSPVPSGATTGRIVVTTTGGTATSATDFTVTVSLHKRTVGFQYRGHTAQGQVNVGDGYSHCSSFVPVYIEQRKNGSWVLVDTTATNGSGSYKTWVPSRSGKFRAQLKKLTLANGQICGVDSSPTRHHS